MENRSIDHLTNGAEELSQKCLQPYEQISSSIASKLSEMIVKKASFENVEKSAKKLLKDIKMDGVMNELAAKYANNISNLIQKIDKDIMSFKSLIENSLGLSSEEADNLYKCLVNKNIIHKEKDYFVISLKDIDKAVRNSLSLNELV
jgi:hypothetical protein